MAAASSTHRLRDELSCSLCHTYFTEPVSIDCGHSFCRGCITQFSERWETEFSCPRCGEISLKTKFRPNKELANVVEVARLSNSEMAESVSGEQACEIHQEPLKFFCKTEQALMCSTCTESKDQATHLIIPVEEAAQEYKEELKTQLEAWSKKQEKASHFHTAERCHLKILQKSVNAMKQIVVSKFEGVEKFLKQQEKSMLDQLEALVEEEEKFVSWCSWNVHLSNALIREMEQKCQQPPHVLLQDIGETLSRSKLDLQKQSIYLELEKRLVAFSKKTMILQEALQLFTEDLSQKLKVKMVEVTLDPDTAHHKLRVSPNQKTLTHEDMRNLKDYPQRFSSSPCVLGCEGFMSGVYYWEVTVQSQGKWAVGVATASVSRRGKNLELEPDEGIWVLSNSYLQSSSGITIGIYLELDARINRVLFFDANRQQVLSTCSLASLKPDKIHPFFFMAKPLGQDKKSRMELRS